MIFAATFFTVMAVCTFAEARKFREGDITALIGPYWQQTAFAATKSGASASRSNGFVLGVNGDISSHGQLEIAIFNANKTYFRELGGKVIGEDIQTVQVDLGYRHWWTTWFNTGLTFFSAYSMGQPTIVHNDFALGSAPDTSAQDTTEYGFDFSLQFEVWSKDDSAVVLSTLYSRSVTPKPGEFADHYGVFIAYRHFVQSKQLISRPKEAMN